MSDVNLFNHDESPFDSIRQVCSDGTEFWSARDLMPVMGYAAWRNFLIPIDRAMKSAENQGQDAAVAFAESRNRVPAGGGSTEKVDFELSRFAAYLVAMNGDPNKPEVAAAQAYFAIRTREAEVAPKVPALDPSTPAGILAMAEQFASTARQLVLESEARQQLEAAVERQAPLVAKAEAHSVSDGAAVNRQTYAREVQTWGKKQGVNILHEQVYEILRRKGMLIAGDRSDRNHASSQAVKSGWAWTKKDVTEDGHATATTYLRPRGQDLAWKWITQHVNEFGDLRPQAVSA